MMLSAVAVLLAAGAPALPGTGGPAVIAGTSGTNGTNGTNGATGATGPQGPQGPAGNGTPMSSLLAFGTVSVGSGCTNASSAATIAVPSKGNVTITASFSIEVIHTSGAGDTIAVFASASRYGGCSDSAGYVGIPSGAAPGSLAYITLATGYMVFCPGWAARLGPRSSDPGLFPRQRGFQRDARVREAAQSAAWVTQS